MRLSPDSLASGEQKVYADLAQYRTAADEAIAHPDTVTAKELANAKQIEQDYALLGQANAQDGAAISGGEGEPGVGALDTPQQESALRETLLAASEGKETPEATQLSQQIASYQQAAEATFAHPETATEADILKAQEFSTIMNLLRQGDSALSEQSQSFFQQMQQTDAQQMSGGEYDGDV